MQATRIRSIVGLFLSTAVLSCGGGGGDSAEPVAAAPAPAPNPAPAPAPVPPLSANATDITGTYAGQVGIDFWGANSNANGGKGTPVDDIPCHGRMDQEFHIHTHLAIVLNGQLLTVPAQLGQVPPTDTAGICYYFIHNHDASGRLHVESATPVNYTLGNWFHIWGQPLSTTNVGGITGLPVVTYVTDNGVTVVHDGDPSTVELKSHRLITIQIGSQLNELPNFVWTGT